MALYEITLEQSYFGQQIINRWNYTCESVPVGASGAYLAVVGMGAIADDDTDPFEDTTVLGQLQALQSASVTFVQMIAKNIYSVTDFFTYAFPPGTIGLGTATPGMAPIDAWGYASDRTRADIRRAQKRFVGLTEGNVDPGGVLGAGFVALAEDLGVVMGNPNSVTFTGVTTLFLPYVFGRTPYTTPSGKTAYKYYDTEAEQEDHIAAINVFNLKPQVRSQVSRQYGRGS